MRRYFSTRSVHLGLWTLFLMAAGVFVWNLLYGPSTWTVFRTTILEFEVSLALRVDSLSTLLFAMVSLLGAAIARYAIRYLDGEERQWYLYRYLALTVVAVSLFVLSSNLLMLIAAWLVTSYGLHNLLVFYSDRPQAIYAARKKIIISRIGDALLIAGIVLTYHIFGTFDFDEIFSEVRYVAADSPDGRLLGIVGFLFVAGSMSKSAQFPFHFWLPETMETPAPVSALMHAGIINAGGFLITRLSPILQEATAAHLLLVLVGAFTAVFGVLVMITQNDIKKKLAYSTIAQMGMMMFACGLGAYTVALFHMFAHSFYKAHAFLSTGTLIDETKKIGFKLVPPPAFALLCMSLAGLGLVLFGLEFEDGQYFNMFTYGAVLSLGLFQNIGSAKGESYPALRVYSGIVIGLGIAVTAYALIELSIGRFLGDNIPVIWAAGGWHSPQGLVSIAAYAIFVMGLWLSAALQRPAGPRMRRLYMLLWNGGYFSQKTTRIIAALAPVH